MSDKKNTKNQMRDEQYTEKLIERSAREVRKAGLHQGVYFLKGSEYGLYYDEATELYVFYREAQVGRGFNTVEVGVSVEHFTDVEITVELYVEGREECVIEGVEEQDVVEWFYKATRGVDSFGDRYDAIFDHISLDIIEPEVAIPYTGGEIQLCLFNPPIAARYTINPEPLTDEEAKEAYNKIEGDNHE